MKVFKFVATDENDKHFEPEIVKYFHAGLDGERSLCGIQCNGDDGYAPDNDVEGYVTCPECLKIIVCVKKMRNWKRPV